MQIDYVVADEDGGFHPVTVDVGEVLKQAMQEDMKETVSILLETLQDSAPLLGTRARSYDMLQLSGVLYEAAQ